MAMDFPNSPIDGQVFTDPTSGNSYIYREDLDLWNAVGTLGYPRLQTVDPIATDRWSRPAGWITMPTMTGSDEKVAALFRVDDHDANFVAFTVSGNYTVDWGDGVTENFSAGATASHTYTYSDADLTDTSGTLGYKQALIVITPQGGAQLTAVNLNVRHPSAYNGKVVTNYLDIALSLPNCGASGFTLGTSGTQYAYPGYLEKLSIYNLGSCTSLAYLCYIFVSLREVYIEGISSVTTLAAAFSACYALEKATVDDCVAVTSANSMFAFCNKIQEVDLSGFSVAWTATYMFQTCTGLTAGPTVDLSKCTDVNNMFLNCYRLCSVPAYDLSACTSVSSMFSGCLALDEIPLLRNTQSVTNWSGFASTTYIKKVARLDTSGATVLNGMFQNCYALTHVPDFDTSNATDMRNMFASCSRLQAIPTLDYSSATQIDGIFAYCYSLTSVSIDLTTNSACSATSIFYACYAIVDLTITAAPKITSLQTAFQYCSRLLSASLPDLPELQSLNTAFQACLTLETVQLGTTPSLTNAGGMFTSCYALKTPPTFDTSDVTTFANMFNSASKVETVPAYNFTAATTMISGLPNGVSKFLPYNIGISLNLSNLRLSKAALETVFGNLKSGVSGQTITLTGNFGVDTAVTKSVNSTALSTTLAIADTSNLEVGMLGTGTFVWSTYTMAADVSADTIGVAGHNIPNGTMVSLTSLGTVTGVSTGTIYYVVNSATDTFQIALTLGGSAIDLTGSNSNVNVQWRARIASIDPNVSVTMDAPSFETRTAASVSFRKLNAIPAILKGWTVTY